jgi:hypothetical protein
MEFVCVGESVELEVSQQGGEEEVFWARRFCANVDQNIIDTLRERGKGATKRREEISLAAHERNAARGERVLVCACLPLRCMATRYSVTVTSRTWSPYAKAVLGPGVLEYAMRHQLGA